MGGMVAAEGTRGKSNCSTNLALRLGKWGKDGKNERKKKKGKGGTSWSVQPRNAGAHSKEAPILGAGRKVSRQKDHSEERGSRYSPKVTIHRSQRRLI